jgi:hypothetical protein
MSALYFTLIHSHLTYCSSLLGILSLKISTKQIKALYITDNSTHNAPTAPNTALKYQILPIDLLSRLTVMHSIEYYYAPNSFDNIGKRIRSGNLT